MTGNVQGRDDLAVTAEELLGVLERIPPEELAANQDAVAKLTLAAASLGEMIDDHVRAGQRAAGLYRRVHALLDAVIGARPEKYAPRAGGEPPNTPPNTTRMPHDGPPEG